MVLAESRPKFTFRFSLQHAFFSPKRGDLDRNLFDPFHRATAEPSPVRFAPSFRHFQPVDLPFGRVSSEKCIIMLKLSGLGAYGEKIFGSSSEYVQSNISRYFSDPQYYFQVNDQYVRNKLKVVLFPFLHRGHWTRITDPIGGRLSYKPPIYDINAPDLYIPFMAFGTYVVLAGFSLGLQGKFTPEALSWLFIKGLLGWFMQVMLLKVTLLSLGCGEAPLLDIVAYAGYAFTGLCLAAIGRISLKYSYYFLMPWTALCMGIFLVKTMKRVLFAEVRSYDSSRHHYLLLFIALAQFPLFTWLGNVSVNWLI
ncbi:Protein YIF1B-A, partial [Cucurbita argyrosperma subsp. sororia]